MKTVLITLLLILSLNAVSGGATIGTITSNGRFEMEGATIWNRGTLLDGARVVTDTTATRLLFNSGSSVQLGVTSAARVYANRVLLENGVLEGSLPSDFRVETARLGLRVEGSGSQAQIRISESGKVLVASLQGALDVRGPQGILVAHLMEGNAVELSAAPGSAAASVKLTGILNFKDGKYTLKDEITGVTSELRGDILAKWAGRRVVLTGDLLPDAKPVPGAEFVVLVQDVDRDAGAAIPMQKANRGGLSGAKKVVVIAGIAVAGGVSAGVVAAGEDKRETVSPQP